MRTPLFFIPIMLAFLVAPARAAAPSAALGMVLVEVVAAAPGTLTVVATPSTVIADGNAFATVTVTLRDGNGHLLPQAQVDLVVSGSSNRLGTPFGVTDASGTFTTSLRSSQTGSKSITATAGAVSGTGAITFLAGAPEPRQSNLAVLPGVAQPADGTTTFLVMATLRDRFSNAVPGCSVAPVSDADDSTFNPASGTTNSDGIFTTQLSSHKAGRQNLSLVVGRGRVVSQASFYGGAPNSLLSGAALTPNAVLQADGLDTFALTVTLVDDHLNPVVGYPVSMSSNGTAVIFSPREGSTNSLGNFVTRIKSHYIGSSTVRWAAGTLSGSEVVTFKVGAPKAITSSIDMVPPTVVADGNSQAVITGTVRDASGNPVPGLNLTFSMGGTANTLSTTACQTDAAGTCATTVTSKQAETKVIVLSNDTFKAKGIGLFVAGNANGALSSLSVNTQNTQVANGYAGFIMGAKLVDAFGNPVGGQALSLVSTTPQDIFKPASGKTNTSGIFNFQVSATATGTRTVTVSAGALALQANVRFGVGPLSPGASTFTAAPAQGIVADGNATSTLTAQLRDAQNRPLVAVPVTFAATGASNTFSAAAPVTDSNGVVSVTLASTHAELKKLTLTAGRVSLGTAVTFVAGAPSQAVSTLTSSPVKPAAAPTNGTRVRVTVLDALGNACGNVPITFAASGSNNAFVGGTGSTNVFGAFTATLSSTRAESKTVTAQVGSYFAKAQNIVFTSGLPSAANTTFTANPATGTPADGATPVTLRVVAQDAFGNPVVGQVVALYASDRFVAFSPKTGFTDATGAFTSQAHGSSAGTKTITAQLGSVSKTANVSYTPVVLSRLTYPFSQGSTVPFGPGSDASVPSMLARPLPPYRQHALLDTQTDAFEAARPTGPWALHIERGGHEEWAVIEPDEPTLNIYTGAPGAWHTEAVPLHACPEQLLAADFNGDGALDLAVVLGRDVAPMLGQAPTGYAVVEPVRGVLSIEDEGAIEARDCNGDGLDDLVVTATDGHVERVLLSVGDGSFVESAR